MAASFVLASLRGSTYGKKYASPLRLLRPSAERSVSAIRGWVGEQGRPFWTPAGL